MSVLNFRCPNCGKSLQAGSEFVGRRTKCPKCNELFRIQADASQSGPITPRQPSTPQPEGPTLVRANEQGLHLTFTWPVVLTFLGCLSVATVAITLIAMMVSTQAPRPAPQGVIANEAQGAERDRQNPDADQPGATGPSDKETDAGTAHRAGIIETVSQAVIRLETDSGSIGTGFLLRTQDLVVTNFHVIHDATSVTAILKNGDAIDVEGWVAVAPQHDLALLRLAKPAAAEPIALANEDPRVGEDVFAVGMPKGLSFSVSKGIIAGYRSWDEVARMMIAEGADPALMPKADASRWIQSDASISPGNSGGPLLSSEGQVLGVNTLSSIAPRSQNLNFAVHRKHVLELIADRQPQAMAFSKLPQRKDPPQRPSSTAPMDEEDLNNRVRFVLDVFAWSNAAEAVGEFCVDVCPMIGDSWIPGPSNRTPKWVKADLVRAIARSAVNAIEKLNRLDAEKLNQPMSGYLKTLISLFDDIRMEARAISDRSDMVDPTKVLTAIRALQTYIVTYAPATKSRMEWNHAAFEDADKVFCRPTGIGEEMLPKWERVRRTFDISNAILTFCDGHTAPKGKRADLVVLWDTFGRESWGGGGMKTLDSIRIMFPDTPDAEQASKIQHDLQMRAKEKQAQPAKR